MEPENKTRSSNFIGKSRIEKTPNRVDLEMQYACAAVEVQHVFRNVPAGEPAGRVVEEI
jgi:hypothetical protein